jgi:zona occludens toxin (predicted ATPase)
MRTTEKPLNEINEEAIILLSKKIGLSNTFRFINQFAKGQNNYTEQRKSLYRDKSLKDILSVIKGNKTKRK